VFDPNEDANLTKGELLLVLARVYSHCEQRYSNLTLIDCEEDVSDDYIDGYDSATDQFVEAVSWACGEEDTEGHCEAFFQAVDVANAGFYAVDAGNPARTLKKDREEYAYELSDERQAEHAAWHDLFAKWRELENK